jgi:hypothetical protein
MINVQINELSLLNLAVYLSIHAITEIKVKLIFSVLFDCLLALNLNGFVIKYGNCKIFNLKVGKFSVHIVMLKKAKQRSL